MIFFLAFGALLSGCDMPSPAFSGIDPVRVVVDGSVFDIRIKANKAEALRLNMEYAPRLGVIGLRAGFAIEQVSGCTVTRIDGDAALVHATLRCGRGAQTPELPERLSYECEIDDFDARHADRYAVADMICYPVPI